MAAPVRVPVRECRRCLAIARRRRGGFHGRVLCPPRLLLCDASALCIGLARRLCLRRERSVARCLVSAYVHARRLESILRNPSPSTRRDRRRPTAHVPPPSLFGSLFGCNKCFVNMSAPVAARWRADLCLRHSRTGPRREQPRGPAHEEPPPEELQLPVKKLLSTRAWCLDEKPGSLAIAFSTRDSDIAHLLAARSRARKHIAPLRKTAPYYSSPLRQLFGTARLARP